jgi:hypothetical protein
LACFSRVSAAVFEEILEQFGGFGFEDASFDGDGVVEATICGDVVEGPGVTGLQVGSSVDEATYAGGVSGTRAHGAWFQGGVEGAAGQTPASQSYGGLTDGEELGVGGGVICGLAFVGGDGQNLLSFGDHGTHGNLAPFGGAFGGEEGAAHKSQVGGGRRGYGVLAHENDDSSRK